MDLKAFLLGWFYKAKTKKGVTRYSEKEIIRLRNKGLTQEQIAEAVGLTRNQVVGILFRLIKEGKISRKKLRKISKQNV